MYLFPIDIWDKEYVKAYQIDGEPTRSDFILIAKGDDAAAQRQMPHSRGSRDTLTGMATARRRLVADSPRRANPYVTATISLPGGRAGEKENPNSQLDAKMLPGTCYSIASKKDMLAKQTVSMKIKNLQNIQNIKSHAMFSYISPGHLELPCQMHTM